MPLAWSSSLSETNRRPEGLVPPPNRRGADPGDGNGGRRSGEPTVGLVRLRGGVRHGLCGQRRGCSGMLFEGTPAAPPRLLGGTGCWDASPGRKPLPVGLKKLVLEPWCNGCGGEGSQSRDCVASKVSMSDGSTRPCDILLYAFPMGLRMLVALLSV